MERESECTNLLLYNNFLSAVLFIRSSHIHICARSYEFNEKKIFKCSHTRTTMDDNHNHFHRHRDWVSMWIWEVQSLFMFTLHSTMLKSICFRFMRWINMIILGGLLSLHTWEKRVAFIKCGRFFKWVYWEKKINFEENFHNLKIC